MRRALPCFSAFWFCYQEWLIRLCTGTRRRQRMRLRRGTLSSDARLRANAGSAWVRRRNADGGEGESAGRRRDRTIIVIGPGDRYLSGVSYYTVHLASALSQRATIGLLFLRRLCPRLVYPGRARVGKTDGSLELPDVPVFNGLDWFWGISGLRAVRFWRSLQPDTVILQWWTAVALHTYIAAAWLARRDHVQLIVEFHEMQDVGEVRLPLVERYTRFGMRIVLRRASAIVVHSHHDKDAIYEAFPGAVRLPVKVILHGPY